MHTLSLYLPNCTTPAFLELVILRVFRLYLESLDERMLHHSSLEGRARACSPEERGIGNHSKGCAEGWAVGGFGGACLLEGGWWWLVVAGCEGRMLNLE